jgi:uncharacterized membrane protein
MSKKAAMMLIAINMIFLLLNVFFMVVGSWPTINFIASLVSLNGTFSAYQLYINADE